MLTFVCVLFTHLDIEDKPSLKKFQGRTDKSLNHLNIHGKWDGASRPSCSGVATGVARGGRVPPLTAKNLPKLGKKSGKIGKKRGKIRKKRQKSGNFFHIAPPDR